jgi:hypothetical protein
VLFGGLLAWAVVEVIVINKQSSWTKPAAKVDMKKEVIAVVASLVLYGVIVGIHYALGYPAFG